jgi:CheY-like chemotaxis protein
VGLSSSTSKLAADKTALVVEDNPAIRKMMVSAFMSNGVFKLCVEAANGEEARKVAQEVHPDIITLDLSMPVMNGMEVAPKLRKMFPKAPIIMFTLYGDGLSPIEAAKSGVSLVLSKSTPLPQLIVIAHRLLGVPDSGRG